MDIFVDTGVVFGYAYTGDSYHSSCKQLFESSDYKDDKFHTSVGIVRSEIDRIRDARIRGFRAPLRIFLMKLPIIFERLSNVAMGDHPRYGELKLKIFDFLMAHRKDTKRKDNDSILLSTSYLWAISNSTLQSPYFITTDKGDIVDNKLPLGQIVCICLTTAGPLEIDYLPRFIQKT